MKRLFKTYFQIMPLLLLLVSCGGGGGGGPAGPSSSIPSTPTGASANAGNQQVTVSWSSVSGATLYNIYWSTSTGVSKSAFTEKIFGESSPYTHTGRTNGTEYFYVVTAENSAGESSESSEVSETPVLDPPGAP